MRIDLSTVRTALIVLGVAIVTATCSNKPPIAPTTTSSTSTSTTSTTSTSSTTTTSVVATSATLTVQLAASCAGVIQPEGMDLFLDNVLVGTVKQNQPYVKTGVPFGTHVIAGRDRLGLLPATTVNIQTPTFTLTVTC